MKLIEKALEIENNSRNPNMIISGSCPQEYKISNGEMTSCKTNSSCEECWSREWTVTLTESEYYNYLKETSILSTEDFDKFMNR